MKKLSVIILVSVLYMQVFSQTPQAISYQSVVRDLNGNPLVEQNVSLRISILEGNIDGDVIYAETHSITTNKFGLINIKIGMGTPVTGNFSSIEWWNNEYFSKMEIDITGGTSYVETGTSQLLSVPYAFHSGTAGTLVDKNGHSPLQISLAISPEKCAGSDDGAVDVTVSGGVPPYHYQWYSEMGLGFNSNTDEDIEDLQSGLYILNVQDSLGNMDSRSIILAPATAIELSCIVNNTSSSGESDGSIDLSCSGGNPPYTYLWSDGSTTEDISGLTEGGYSVTVTDANGCTGYLSCFIGENIETITDAEIILDELLSILKGQEDYNLDAQEDDYMALLYLLSDLPTDNAQHAGSNNDLAAFSSHTLNVSNPIVESIWYLSYKMIFKANRLLNQVEHIQGATTEEKNMITGRAKFLRAFAYLILVEKFSGVPIYDDPGDEGQYLSNNTKQEVYDYIEADLTAAMSYLPATGTENTEITSNAAKGLLCRVYLNTQAWSSLSAKAAEIINSALYSLGSFEQVFTTSPAAEVLWKLDFSAAEKNKFAYYTFPVDSGGIKEVTARQDLADAFSTGDPRKTTTLATVVTDHIIYKFRDPVSGDYDLPVIRYSEIILMYAEALNELGSLSAYDYLNQILIRAGLSPWPVGFLTQVEMRNEIWSERRLELAFEGHRWNDLVRTGTAQATLSNLGVSVASHRLVWPIPQSALNANPNLMQNPGY